MLAAVVISFATVSLYIAPFVPIATALLTRASAPPWLKLGLTAALAAVETIVVTAIQASMDVVVEWATLGRIAMAFGIAMGSYFAFRKPVIDPIAATTAGVIG